MLNTPQYLTRLFSVGRYLFDRLRRPRCLSDFLSGVSIVAPHHDWVDAQRISSQEDLMLVLPVGSIAYTPVGVDPIGLIAFKVDTTPLFPVAQFFNLHAL